MVAKITFPKRMGAALNYNENKLAKEKAVCLGANGYLKDARDMNFYQKLEGLHRNHILNDRAATKTLHVSLNFDPSENINDDKLSTIANAYMEKIGFGDQPYLVYRHQDAGHPHIHIVSTTIKDDGSRINTHNIGKNASEKARKELEGIFNLVRAEDQKKKIAFLPKPIDVEKATYGKSETKSSIANIVGVVFQGYRFTSIPEYNAALKQFNVAADRGKEEGRIYRNSGLVYRLLDEEGNKVGVPIKASSIACQPTLSALEKKFKENEAYKEELKHACKHVIENAVNKAQDMEQLIKQLADQQVCVVLRQNNEGRIYGITFVDNRLKCVFNGSDLGKGFSAATIQSRLYNNANNLEPLVETEDKGTPSPASQDKTIHQAQEKKLNTHNHADKLFDQLLSAKEQFDNVPSSLLNKNRKKKKRRNPNSTSS